MVKTRIAKKKRRQGPLPTGPLEDLTNRRFGRLRVIEYSHQDPHRVSIWKCKCDCGETVDVISSNLLLGRTKSCGCLKTEVLIGRAEDLRGQRFERLVAKEYVRIPNSRGASWLCQCDCGNEIVVKAYQLKNGNTKSCGCLRKENRNFLRKKGK